MGCRQNVIKLGLVVLVVLAATACSRHDDEDIVAISGLVLSPAPDSLVVTTSNDIVYDLEWFVSDTTNVRDYRIYNLDFFTGLPLLLASTTVDTTTATVNTLIPTPGIVFGVSSVSTGDVESSITFGSADSP